MGDIQKLTKENVDNIDKKIAMYLQLSDNQLILHALSEIIAVLDTMPIGIRLPLSTALMARAKGMRAKSE